MEDVHPLHRPHGGAQHWAIVLALFSMTSMVETIGVSQVFAFMPLYLAGLGLPANEIPHWVGLLGALVFLVGLPLVPLWGVWADKYSRKAVIIRSALVETAVFVLVAISRDPWQFAASLSLAGLQLGNTGVMLSAQRQVTPERRLGFAMAALGASGSIGFAVGPAIGGFIIDGLGAPISAVYLSSGALCLASAAALWLGLREVPPETRPEGSALRLAYGAITGIARHRGTLGLFGLFALALLARQMVGPFLPLLVERVNGPTGLASAIALVVGTAALLGTLMSPLAGALGDRVGFNPMLLSTLTGGALALALMPLAPEVAWLAGLSAVFSALMAGVSAMVFGLLALETPVERRSATLNLVYLPLYVSGIVGPAIGALIVELGLAAVFYAGALALLASVAVARGRPGQAARGARPAHQPGLP